MAAVLSITFYILSCLLPFIPVATAEYCYYYTDYNSGGVSLGQRSKYCSNGCCNTGTDATTYNVCCYDNDNDYVDDSSDLIKMIIGISVGVVACIISIVVVIIIIACCCCKRRPSTQGSVITAPNTAVVYSNSVQTSTIHPGVAYPPQGTNLPASPPTGYSAPPPAYDTVTSPEQDNKGFQTHVNMN